MIGLGANLCGKIMSFGAPRLIFPTSEADGPKH